MDRVRLSVALVVDEPEATEINGLRRALGSNLAGQAPPHVTLVPPVNVADDEVDRALTIVRQAAASVVGPISVTLGPIGNFASNGVLFLPVGNFSRTLRSPQETLPGRADNVESGLRTNLEESPIRLSGWKGRSGGTRSGAEMGTVSMRETDALATIEELRQRVMRPPLWRHVSHEFVPHVTLRTNPDAKVGSAALIALAGFKIPVTFRYLSVLRLDSTGVWSSLAECPLGKPLVRGRGTFVRELRLVQLIAPDVANLFEGATVGSQILEARDAGGVLIGALGFAIETVVYPNSGSEVTRHVRGRVISLCVVAEERGFGLGSMLVQEALRHIQACGCETVFANIENSLLDQQSNGALAALAQRFGTSDCLADRSKLKGTVATIVRYLT
jgi:2'-5' RNA ligase/GNAT superfamily N-acetyltransferase